MQEHPLTDKEYALISEYLSAMQGIQQQLEGAIKMIGKQNDLDGNWQLQGNKLVKPESEPPKEN